MTLGLDPVEPDAADAVNAWQSISVYRQTLTTIFMGVLVPLVRAFSAGRSHDYSPMVHSIAAAFVVDGEHRGNPEAAQATLGFGSVNDNPGGSWHKLVNAGWRLRLNTSAEARAICDEYDKAKHSSRDEHFAAQARMQAQVDAGYVEIGNP